MMDSYVTGDTIRALREEKSLTQEDLAGRIHVSAKAVSKWETGRGLPDISLLEPLAKALNVSVIELMNGAPVRNRNGAGNMLRGRFYLCPVCGNTVQAAGDAVVSCCGITLPPLEKEEDDGEHRIRAEISDGEWYVTVDHPMTKEHRIVFLAAVSDREVQFVRLYPEEAAEARFRMNGVRRVYALCNRHGLYETDPRKQKGRFSP